MYHSNPDGECDQTTSDCDSGTKTMDQLGNENEALVSDDDEPIAKRLRKRVCKNSASRIELPTKSVKGRPRTSKKACEDSTSIEYSVKAIKGRSKTSTKVCKDSVNKATVICSKAKYDTSLKNKQKRCVKRPRTCLQVTKSFSYHKDLKPVFGNAVWIEILQEICDVQIDQKSDCTLNIMGEKSSVASAVSAMKELAEKHSECSNIMCTSDKNLSQKLVSALKMFLNKDTSLNPLDGIPNTAVTSLLSQLAVTYKESSPVINNSPSLDDSVMILNISTPQIDDSVISLNSDSDTNSSFELCLRNSSSESKVNIKAEKQEASSIKLSKNIDISLNAFHGIPDNIISLISSLLEKAHEENKENTSLCDDSPCLEDSIVIIDTPQKKTKTALTAFVLNDDSEQPQNKKQGKTESKKGTYIIVVLQGGDSLQKNLLQQSGQQQITKTNSTEKNELTASNANCLSSESTNHIANDSAEKNSKCFLEPHVPSPIAPVHPLAIPAQPAILSVPQSFELPVRPPAQPAMWSPQPPAQSSMGQPAILHGPHASETRLRPVVIDGSNVALYQTEGKPGEFSWKRIEISMKYFLDRGHNVKVFIPHHRGSLCYKLAGKKYIEDLERKSKILVFTPSRKINGRNISCYDDRFIVDFAYRTGGVILSNDNYRDLMIERTEWKNVIEKRLLMFVFVDDEFMIPEDPLGRCGPKLKDFLSFPERHIFYGRR